MPVGRLTPIIVALYVTMCLLWGDNGNDKKSGFYIDASVDAFMLGEIYRDVFRPAGITNPSYGSHIEYLPSGGQDHQLIKRFEPTQYQSQNHGGRNIDISQTTYTPQLFSFTLAAGYEISPLLRLGLRGSVWWGQQEGGYFNKFLVLADRDHFRGVITADKKDLLQVLGFLGGATLDIRIPKLQFLKIVPFINIGIEAGRLTTLKSTSDIYMTVAWVAEAGISPLTNAEGQLKNESEIANTDFDNRSVNNITIVKEFQAPWVLNNTLHVGLEYELFPRVSAQLYGGLTWYLLEIDRVSVEYTREYALLSDDSQTQYQEGPLTQRETFSEAGFFHQSVGWKIGLTFFFEI